MALAAEVLFFEFSHPYEPAARNRCLWRIRRSQDAGRDAGATWQTFRALLNIPCVPEQSRSSGKPRCKHARGNHGHICHWQRVQGVTAISYFIRRTPEMRMAKMLRRILRLALGVAHFSHSQSPQVASRRSLCWTSYMRYNPSGVDVN